jgi:hypothetical protein
MTSFPVVRLLLAATLIAGVVSITEASADGGYPPGGVNVVTGRVSERAVAPGQAVAFSGTGFRPGSVVRLSTGGAETGVLTADPHGAFRATLRPRGAAGDQVLAAAGVDGSGRVRVVTITVRLVASSNAAGNSSREAGPAMWLALLGGFGVVALGAAGRLGRHRRWRALLSEQS